MTPAENELLTRTGPDTPMGETLRRYWVPALMSEELSEADCPPVRVTLLSEELVAFRDTSGRVGLVDLHCAHRGASLFFGRNEECGLRCVYHGWKYDVDGNCVDMPNEPPASNFKDKIHLKAYPCRERGGIVWAYLGPSDQVPALPELEWALVPASHRVVSKRLQDCNYLQAVEGGVDLSHISVLHRNFDSTRDGADMRLAVRDAAPKTETVESAGGVMIAARRNAGERNSYYWRINQYLLPWYTMFPPLVDEGIGGHAFVPLDDEHCWVYSINWHPTRPLAAEGDPADDGVHADLIPGSWRPLANRDNDYCLDRSVQRTQSFTGIRGFAAQDCAAQESMGAIYDRSQERLVASDLAIIAVRRRLLESVRAVQAGRDPPGLDAAACRVRPAALVLPADVPFQEGARDVLIAPAPAPAVGGC